MKNRILSVVFFFLFACSMNPDESGTPAQKAFKYVNITTPFYLYPNDLAVGDSVKRLFPHGVVSMLQVGGRYQLKIKGNYSTPKLHIYTMVPVGANYNINSDGETYDLSQNTDGTWSVSFVGSNQTEVYRCLLITDGVNQASVPTTLALTGVGDFSNHFSLHLMVLADYFESRQDSVQALKAMIRQTFDQIYSPQGILLDSIYVSYKATHPKYGAVFSGAKSFYLDHERWLLAYNFNGKVQSMDFDEISNGFGAPYASAIQVALIDGVASNSMIIGLSPFFGKSVYAGDASTIELSTYHGKELNRTLEMARTLAHEFGHFIGLRHTTIPKAERVDLSVFEDGLSDTPYEKWCLANQGLVPQSGSRGVSLIYSDLAFNQDNCPDVTNLMFPFADSNNDQFILSAMQFELAKANLSLLPR